MFSVCPSVSVTLLIFSETLQSNVSVLSFPAVRMTSNTQLVTKELYLTIMTLSIRFKQNNASFLRCIKYTVTNEKQKRFRTQIIIFLKPKWCMNKHLFYEYWKMFMHMALLYRLVFLFSFFKYHDHVVTSPTTSAYWIYLIWFLEGWVSEKNFGMGYKVSLMGNSDTYYTYL